MLKTTLFQCQRDYKYQEDFRRKNSKRSPNKSFSLGWYTVQMSLVSYLVRFLHLLRKKICVTKHSKNVLQSVGSSSLLQNVSQSFRQFDDCLNFKVHICQVFVVWKSWTNHIIFKVFIVLQELYAQRTHLPKLFIVLQFSFLQHTYQSVHCDQS